MPWKECSVMDERLRFVGPAAGRRGDDGCLPGVRHLPQDRLQDLRPLQGAGLEALTDRSRRPVRYANQLPQQIERPDRRAQAGEAALGRAQDPRAPGPAARRRCRSPGQEHHPRRARSPRPGQTHRPAAAPRRTARPCRRARSPTICGAPTSRASSSSATGATAIRSPSPTTPRAFCCCAKPWNRPAKTRPLTAFERLFRERGLPRAIRSDNGVPFASPNALFNLSKLSVWWLRLGIAIERIKPGHPQQNGRHERMHLTLKKEATRPPGMNSLQQQARFDDFVHEFNAERPHEALAMKCPAEVYAPQPGPMAACPNSPTLPRPRRPRHRLRPHLHAPQEDQHLNRARRPEARHQGSRRRHLARQLHALRSRLHRPGAENPATPRQPVRPEVVTYVLGTFCYLCLRAGQMNLATPAGFEPATFSLEGCCSIP